MPLTMEKKPVKPSPTSIQIPPELSEPLEQFIADQEFPPTKSEVLRALIRDFLVSRGYLEKKS